MTPLRTAFLLGASIVAVLVFFSPLSVAHVPPTGHVAPTANAFTSATESLSATALPSATMSFAAYAPQATHEAPPLHEALPAYVSPTSGGPTPGRVLRYADIPERNWQPGHRGVDLELAAGADVRAAGAGRIAFAGTIAGMPSVSIDHTDGLCTTYQPVWAHVSVGDSVTSGQVIGQLAPHPRGEPGLHWGALTGPDTYINPLSLLQSPLIRLKPITDNEPPHTPTS